MLPHFTAGVRIPDAAERKRREEEERKAPTIFSGRRKEVSLKGRKVERAAD